MKGDTQSWSRKGPLSLKSLKNKVLYPHNAELNEVEAEIAKLSMILK